MINFLFPIINKIDYWLSVILPFTFRNLFWGLFTGILAFIIYAILSNQSVITNIKIDIKSVRKKMFDPALDNKSDYNILAKKNLALSFKLLGKIFLPAILSIIPVLTMAIWYDMYHSYYIPYNQEGILITSEPETTNLLIYPKELTFKDSTGNIFLNPQNSTDSVTIYIDKNIIYSSQLFSAPIPFVTKQKWWNFLLNDEVGYITRDSPIYSLHINYPAKVIFKNLPDIINGWELLFFIGIFISAISLRIIFKVQ
ncbi:MAG: hypothetical protein GWP19_05940 [Planctomycetia bacterium]|nr:hypothetical protein [Planctomycetia bacterium]